MESICIIGGGASALMCASHIKNKKTTIFESAEKVGKKILATGNGRCNLTNMNMNKYSYNINVDNFIKMFDQNQTLSFFKMLGLETYADEEGRVYPISNTATSVLSVLKNHIIQKDNIIIETNKEVVDICACKNGYKLIFADNSYQIFDKVVVASGNYTNLSMFDKFNISYKKFIPSLCSLKTEKHKNLTGVRASNVKVRCNVDGTIFEEIGEILFKDEGISGIVIFNLSSYMARKNSFKNTIFIDFLPYLDENSLNLMLNNRKCNLQNLTADEFLTGIFHKQINLEILKRANINLVAKVKNLTEQDINNIGKVIKNYKLNVSGYYENNQVVCGGICLDQLTEKLESKTNNGLYFIGEVVDVDGVCGGYNLQWAWTSGKIVGESI